MKITKSELKQIIREEAIRFNKINMLENRKKEIVKLLNENEIESIDTKVINRGDLGSGIKYVAFEKVPLTDSEDITLVDLTMHQPWFVNVATKGNVNSFSTTYFVPERIINDFRNNNYDNDYMNEKYKNYNKK